MNQISADHEKLRNVLIPKLGLPTDRFQRDNQIAEAVSKLIKERDDALQRLEGNTLDWELSEAVEVLRSDRNTTHNALYKLLKGDY